MGVTGIGLPDDGGDLAGNPAAMGSGLDLGQGAVHACISWSHLSLESAGLNTAVVSKRDMDMFSGRGFSAVTPRLGQGRIGAGVWQMDRRAFEMAEPLDLELKLFPGATETLSSRYSGGDTKLREAEELYAAGVVWVHELFSGSLQVAAGGAHFMQASRGSIEAAALESGTGDEVSVLRFSTRRVLRGWGGLAGLFYRPVVDACVGVSVTCIGPLRGDVRAQSQGEDAWRDTMKQPARQRIGVGGSVDVGGAVIAAEVRYLAGTEVTTTLFRGTAARRSFTEKAEEAMDIRAGIEVPLRLGSERIPVRAGFFMSPDALPSRTEGFAATALPELNPPAFRQDVVGYSLGGGLVRGPLSADLAFVLLQVQTRVKQQGPAGWVEITDASTGFGAVASVSFRFGEGVL